MRYQLNATGKQKAQTFVEELKAQRDELVSTGKDTADETILPTIEDIEADLDIFVGWDKNYPNEYYTGWSVTDRYESKPLQLILGVDFVDTQMGMSAVA